MLEEVVVIKTRKNPILPIILNFYFINQIGLLNKNGPTMTFRCNSKENLHHLSGPLDHHFWPITTLSHISHISNTKKWPTWGRSEGVTRIVTPISTPRHTYSNRRMLSHWTPSSSSATAEQPHLSRNETQESSTSTENMACSIGRSDPHIAPSLARNSWGTRREPYRY